MAYGVIKVDNITFTNGGADQPTTVSGIYRAITSGVTVTGTISGATIQGATVSGTAGIFGSGSVSSPSISFTSDPNTGIYSPAADTLAFVEGGVEALRIDSSGRVGIGTSTPDSPLHVLAPGGIAGLRVGYNSTSVNYYDADTQIFRRSSAAESLRIDSSGNVGIGTSVIYDTLTVNGTIGTIPGCGARLRLYESTTPRNNVFIAGADADGAYIDSTYSTGGSGALIFRALGTERMRVASNGNIGIATTTPQSKLDLGLGTDGARQISWHTDASTSYANIWSSNNGGRTTVANGLKGSITVANGFESSVSALWGRAATEWDYGRITFYTDAPSTVAYGTAITPTERMRINDSGNVGIGTSSPIAGLHVSNGGVDTAHFGEGTSGAGINIKTRLAALPTTGTNANIAWLESTSGFSAGSLLLSSRPSTGSVVLSATGAANLVIAPSTGNVGIGTSTPSTQGGQKLTVSDGFIAVSTNFSSGTSGELRFIGRPDGVNYNWAGIRTISDVNMNQGVLSFFTSATNTSGEASTERLRIDSSGRLLVGTSSARDNFRFGITNYIGTFQHESAVQPFLTITGGTVGAPGPYLVLAKQRSGTVGGNTVVVNDDDLGVVTFQGSDGTNMIEGARIEAKVDGTPGANDMPGRLVFSTTADGAATLTERMRIGNIGYLKVSNTGVYTDTGGGARVATTSHFFRSDQNAPTILSTNTNTSSAVEGFTSDFPAGATGNHFIGANALARVFIVAANGNVTNTNNSYGAISDIKLKENIVNANSQWDDLKALQVRNYNFKEGQTHTQIGLVAQEAELVSPGLVSESPDLDVDGNELGTVTKSVNYSVLYMKAVKALQEAMERIETLEARLTAAGIE
jgi:hypothetical protein